MSVHEAVRRVRRRCGVEVAIAAIPAGHTSEVAGRSGNLLGVPTLLVVHHTPSPALHALLQAVLDGAAQVEGVDVRARPALTASPVDVLECDGYVLGTPANLGMVSGALKHFFDGAYYPALDATAGRPFGLYVHGNDDVAGAVANVERIVTGLRWQQVHDHVPVLGPPTRRDTDACWDLGATVAARLVF